MLADRRHGSHSRIPVSRSIYLLAGLCVIAGCRTSKDLARSGEATPPAVPTWELSGLRATVSPALANEEVLGPTEVSFELEWTAPPQGWIDSSGTICVASIWLLRPLEPAVVRYWNAAGMEVGAGGQQIQLSDEFRVRASEKQESRLRIDPPAGATLLSVSLGRSGLETARIAVPAAPVLRAEVPWLGPPPK